MAQSLTAQDRKDLLASVPAEFLQIDKQFHQLAATLAGAGKQEDTRQQVDVFGQMTQTCIACHSRFVTVRFNGLGNPFVPDG